MPVYCYNINQFILLFFNNILILITAIV